MQYVFRNPHAIGDWKIIEADSEEQARKRLTKLQRSKYTSVRVHRPTREVCPVRGEFAPIPGGGKRR